MLWLGPPPSDAVTDDGVGALAGGLAGLQRLELQVGAGGVWEGLRSGFFCLGVDGGTASGGAGGRGLAGRQRLELQVGRGECGKGSVFSFSLHTRAWTVWASLGTRMLKAAEAGAAGGGG